MAKTIGALWVKHQPEKVAEVLQALFSKAKKGQRLGLETTPEDLVEFERIRKLEKKRSVSFFREYGAFHLKQFQEAARLVGWPEEEVATIRLEDKWLTPAKFFYGVYKAAVEKGLKISPLGTRALRLRKLAVQFKRASTPGMVLIEGNLTDEAIERIERAEKLAGLHMKLIYPVSDRVMSKKIASAKPDFIVIGNGHKEGLESCLKQNGILAKELYYRDAPSGSHLVGIRQSTAEYLRRKKSRMRPQGKKSTPQKTSPGRRK